MSRCKYDRDKHDYLTDDGKPCRHDDEGDPTFHCTAQRTCSWHIAPTEQTCARCIGRTRDNIRAIVDLSALTTTQALNDGVDSEAANLAGPAADYETFMTRRSLDRRWLLTHIPTRHLESALRALLEDDDEHHPYTVLTRWEYLVRDHYQQPRPTIRTDVAQAAGYLTEHLHRIAQDPDQDFPQLLREVRNCRQHLESVLHNSTRKERGAPCPECSADGKFIRLTREYAHWCDDDDCELVHHDTDEADEWACPRRPKLHRWSEKAYRDYIEERKGA